MLIWKIFSTDLRYAAHNHRGYLVTMRQEKTKEKQNLRHRVEVQNLGNSISSNGIPRIRLTLALKTTRKARKYIKLST